MSPRKPVTDDELSEYVDGGLSEERRGEIAAWLLENPKKAAEVERLRQLNDALRGLGAEILDEPVPDRLREVVRRGNPADRSGTDDRSGDGSGGKQTLRRRSGSGTLEMVLACTFFVLGGTLGWGSHESLAEEAVGIERIAAEAGAGAPVRQGADSG